MLADNRVKRHGRSGGDGFNTVERAVSDGLIFFDSKALCLHQFEFVAIVPGIGVEIEVCGELDDKFRQDGGALVTKPADVTGEADSVSPKRLRHL